MKAWTEFLQQQEARLGADVIKRWLLPLKIIHFDSANLYLEASDSFQLLWFEEHIRPLLKTELLNANCRPIKVHLTLTDGAPKQTAKPIAPPLTFAQDKLDPHMVLDHFIAGKNVSALSAFFLRTHRIRPRQKRMAHTHTLFGAFQPHLPLGRKWLWKNPPLDGSCSRIQKKRTQCPLRQNRNSYRACRRCYSRVRDAAISQTLSTSLRSPFDR